MSKPRLARAISIWLAHTVAPPRSTPATSPPARPPASAAATSWRDGLPAVPDLRYTSPRVARMAGTSPQTSVDSRTSPPANGQIRLSRAIASCSADIEAGNGTKFSATASGSPTAAPAPTSKKLSASIARKTRPRAAPRATRIASSRRRCVARAISSPMTLTHAMSSTRPDVTHAIVERNLNCAGVPRN